MIRHSPASHAYPASHYDEQMCLKPPLLLWLAALYLSRTLTLPLAMALSHFAGVDPEAIAKIRGLWSVDGLVPSLMAAMVLYALCRRVPTASPAARWIWARGRILLALAALLDFVLLLLGTLREGEINSESMVSIVAAPADLYFLLYILIARRVRHAFAEFPTL